MSDEPQTPDTEVPPQIPASVAEELAVMRKLHAALESLDDRDAQRRVLAWLFDRYGVEGLTS